MEEFGYSCLRLLYWIIIYDLCAWMGVGVGGVGVGVGVDIYVCLKLKEVLKIKK